MSGLCRPQKHGPKLGQSQSPSTANVALNAVTEQVRRQKVTSLDRVLCIHDTSVDTPALRPHQQQHSRQLVAAYIPFSWMDASCRQETTTLPSEESAAAKGDSPGDVDEQRRAENARLAVVPPYWQHRRYESYASANIVRPPAIILEDHTEDLEPNCQTPLWAKEVSLQDYVVVSGNIPSVGDYVVWNCTIQTLDGGSITIRKRYSEFEELRRKLLITFPNAGAAMPPLPPKSIFRRFRPDFLEKRRAGLAYFMNCVLLNPDFSSAPVLKGFILD